MTSRSEAPGASAAQVLDRQVEEGAGRDDDARPPIATSAGDVLLAHVREQVEQARTYDLPVRADAPDSVHKMRVAVRRLRSALTTFEPLVDPDVVRPLRGELRWWAGELGAARDAEVMRDRVRKTIAGEGEHAGDPAATIVGGELEQAYRTAHDRVLAEMDGERYAALVSALERLVLDPPLTARARAAAQNALPPLVARSYAQLRRIVEKAVATPEGDEREELLHDARKAAKRARYAAESVSGVFGAEASAFAGAMEAVQEALGEYQDSVFTRERLRALARQTSSTDAAFLYGRLHALEEAGSAQSQRHFEAAWKAAARKPLHRWLR